MSPMAMPGAILLSTVTLANIEILSAVSSFASKVSYVITDCPLAKLGNPVAEVTISTPKRRTSLIRASITGETNQPDFLSKT